MIAKFSIGKRRRFIVVEPYWISEPVILVVVAAIGLTAGGNCDAQNRPATIISRIAPGTQVTATGVKGWSHVVMVATPHISGDDVDNVSPMVLRYASMFTTVIAANVTKSDQGYQLRKIGIGLAVADGANFRIVSARAQTHSDEHSQNLGMIATSVLQVAEQSLEKITISLRHRSAIFIDSPAIVRIEGEHQDLTARHLIWVQPKSGRISSALWFIRTGETSEVVGGRGVLLPANFRERRRLRIDPGEFFFGIPGVRAFALEGLPTGRKFPLDQPIAEAAGAQKLTLQDWRLIAGHLVAVMKAR